MVLDKFNMVDMEGIDIIRNSGDEIPGLHQKLVESIAQCRYQCIYNWYSDGILIPPTYVEMEVESVSGDVQISTNISVTPSDLLTTTLPHNYFGRFILWRVEDVTSYAGYDTAADFRNAKLSALLNEYPNIAIFCEFKNNTLNSRAAIDYCYMRVQKFNDASDTGHRVGGYFAASYGANVYPGSQIYIYYAVLDL